MSASLMEGRGVPPIEPEEDDHALLLEALAECINELICRCDHDDLMPDWTAEVIRKANAALAAAQPAPDAPPQNSPRKKQLDALVKVAEDAHKFRHGAAPPQTPSTADDGRCGSGTHNRRFMYMENDSGPYCALCQLEDCRALSRQPSADAEDAEWYRLLNAASNLAHYAECVVDAFGSGRPALDMTLFPTLCKEVREAIDLARSKESP